MASCRSFDDSVDQQLTREKVDQELERYRRKGAGPTARMLLEGLSRAGVSDGVVLDIGAGVGALTFALLERGMRRAVIVEASAAYAAAAADEATRRRRSTDIELVPEIFSTSRSVCRARRS